MQTMNLPFLLQNFNASSLGKRQNPNMEQEDLQKKLKTTFAPMPFQPNFMPFNNNFMQNFEHMQNFQMLLSMNQAFPQLPMMPKTVNKPVINTQMAAKNQYVKQEESPIMVKSETNHTANETASEISEGRYSPISAPEPVLAEYTKAFPDWDIGTIFSFLQSGQSKESFEKEKEFRAERKKRRAAKKRQIATKKTAPEAVAPRKINVKLE